MSYLYALHCVYAYDPLLVRLRLSNKNCHRF